MNTEVMVDAQVHIRWMIRRDMDEVLQIENECFEFPWSEEDWISELRQRNCIAMVAEVAECITGVMLYEFKRDHLHVLNFAVRRDCQRRGIGTALVNKLKSKLSHERRKSLLLEIRETNLAAQQFFAAQGFRAVGISREHYRDTTEDAYVFRYRLPVCEGK